MQVKEKIIYSFDCTFGKILKKFWRSMKFVTKNVLVRQKNRQLLSTQLHRRRKNPKRACFESICSFLLFIFIIFSDFCNFVVNIAQRNVFFNKLSPQIPATLQTDAKLPRNTVSCAKK